ncbi:D-alanine--D-alanine ligase [Collinsella tanakaei]|nr:D-alanine--D-alanine ligase [Collinsella tanakaei]
MGSDQRSAMRIAVLAGGMSSEREISFSSGKNAAAALREAGFGTVDLLDPADKGFLDDIRAGGYDAAFIALHGAGGEDGMIQHLMEYLDMPYTGSDALASACGVDKDLSKALYERAGIPVADGVAIRRGEKIDPDAIVASLGHDLFVKPAINGSSYGVTKVSDAQELPKAIERAFEYSSKVLVESCLTGTEITVGVFGDDDSLRALPIVEICCPDEVDFYDLSVKYVVSDSIHRIPARLPEDVYAQAQELACRAHRALGCFGFSRTDFIVTKDGPVILETNTIPGMTETSLFPDEVRHEGRAFSDVCAELVDMAIARHGRK